MASERSMRKRVTHALRDLDAMAVENLVMPGTPDVEYIGGWIELKSLADWPARAQTPVAIRHFDIMQRIWLDRRCKRGGAAWLLLRVKRSWLLLDGSTAAAIVGKATRQELIDRAVRYWPATPSDQDLLDAFRKTADASS